MTDPTAAAPAIAAALDGYQRILLLSHINPDGDAIGSMLGLAHVLRGLGKEPIPLASSAFPAYTRILPGIETVQVADPTQPLPEADAIWLVDTASLARIGVELHARHAELIAQRPLIIVDHHVTNTGEGSINLIRPASASCAELLHELFKAMGAPISPEAATCLLLGIISDTQSFQTNSTVPDSLRAAADLIALGANHRAVVDAIYFATPAATVALVGLALAEMQQGDGIFWASVTQAMMAATGAEEEASDEVVQMMQRIEGAKLCALFKERKDGTVKISLRSMTSQVNVAAIAQTWGGGGHMRAAGATLLMDLPAAQAEVLPRLQAALAEGSLSPVAS